MLFLILAVVAIATSVHPVASSNSSNVIKAKMAQCMPELQVVSVVGKNPDPSETYFPSCVRVKRCGGCCNNELLSCQPTAINTLNYEISVLQLGRDRNEKKIVQLEEHTACKCDCRVKAKDCTDKQYYMEEDCICNCKDSEAKEMCDKENETKYWDPNSCSCNCRNVQICSTYYYFDTDSCSCKRE